MDSRAGPENAFSRGKEDEEHCQNICVSVEGVEIILKKCFIIKYSKIYVSRESLNVLGT